MMRWVLLVTGLATVPLRALAEDATKLTADARGTAAVEVTLRPGETVDIASLSPKWLTSTISAIPLEGRVEIGGSAPDTWLEAREYRVALRACAPAQAKRPTPRRGVVPAKADVAPPICRSLGVYAITVPKRELAIPEQLVLKCVERWPSDRARCDSSIVPLDKATAEPVAPFDVAVRWMRGEDGEASNGELSCPQGKCTAKGFDLGITKGKLFIRAARLESPATVAVEVHSRLSSIWLIGLIVLGIGAGWYVRVRLASAIEAYEAVAAARKLADELERTHEFQNDKAYAKALSTSIDGLRAARSATNANTAVKAAQEAVEALRADRAPRKLELESALRTHHDVLDRAWLVPEEVLAELASARALLAKAEAAATSGNLTNAVLHEATLRGYGARLQKTVQEWLDRPRDGWFQLKGFSLPQDIAAQLDHACKAIPQRQAKVDALALLNASHAAFGIAFDALDSIARSITRKVRTNLKSAPNPDLEHALGHFEEAWAAAPLDIEKRARLLEDAGASLVQKVGKLDTRLAIATAATPSAPGAPSAWRGLAAVHPSGELEIPQLEQRARQLRLLQWTLAASITVVAGYLLFAAKFYGTVADVLALLAWGATANQTVDKALELLTQLKRS